MKAIAVGPTNRSSRPCTPASAAARLTSVFFATRYFAPAPRARRSSVSWDTERPSYLVITAAELVRKSSASSATAATLLGFAIQRLLSWLATAGIEAPTYDKRPGAGRRGAYT